MAVTFTVPGRIGGKQRAGRMRLPGGAVRSFNPKKTESQEAMVRTIAAMAMRQQRAVPIEGPVALTIDMQMRPPRSWSAKRRAAARWVTGKPDADNTAKLVSDALNGICWNDDSQIARLLVTRRYAVQLVEAVDITVESLDA